jgi:hypothetical protein
MTVDDADLRDAASSAAIWGAAAGVLTHSGRQLVTRSGSLVVVEVIFYSPGVEAMIRDLGGTSRAPRFARTLMRQEKFNCAIPFSHPAMQR